eukprot:6328866-Prymnesium_polylepis.1
MVAILSEGYFTQSTYKVRPSLWLHLEGTMRATNLLGLPTHWACRLPDSLTSRLNDSLAS